MKSPRTQLEKILKTLAVLTIKRYQPKIIGITGSVGKTSAKEAIYLVLSRKYRVRKNIANYNNEIGVPLTIIGEKTAGKNILGWIVVFIKSLLKLVKTRYPEILVLEMGIDKPGDMDYLINFVKPDISIITAISEIPVHLENFSTVKELTNEKFKILKNLSDEDYAIVNIDNGIIKNKKINTKAKIISIGIKEKADVYASNIIFDSNEAANLNSVKGISFKLHYQKSSLPVRLPEILAEHQIYSVLCAAACGIIFNMNLIEISEALRGLRSPKGRLNIIPGIKRTTIIDDTYNASPDSVRAALNVLSMLPFSGRKIAVLGDMRELGEESEKAHREIGMMAVKTSDILITVGDEAKYIFKEAENQGLSSDKIFHFQNSEKAGLFIQNKILMNNDLLLIKGSQAVRMEKIVKELMAEPMKSKMLLVRQERKWLKKMK